MSVDVQLDHLLLESSDFTYYLDFTHCDLSLPMILIGIL